MMDPVSVLIDKVKGVAKSSERIVNSAVRKCCISSIHDPIEILKRLQREAFSDIMKLRDRQEKTEHVLSLYKSTKMGPFLEATTRIKGLVDFAGSIVFVENDVDLSRNALERAGIQTGIDLRFIFKTAVRQKDWLVAEFAARQNSLFNSDNPLGSPLTLEKLVYAATINDCFSLTMSPLGAFCNELGVASSFEQDSRMGKASRLYSPRLTQQYNCGAGVIYNSSNIATSLAGLVSSNKSLNAFAQMAYQPFQETILTLSCLWEMKENSCFHKFGTLAIPMHRQKRSDSTDRSSSSSSSSSSPGSLTIMLETELDESSSVNGWVELQNSNKVKQWGASLSDLPDNEVGWGLRIGGTNEGNYNQFQLEGFLNFSFGRKISLQPCIVYATDGKNRTPALVFRSNCLM